MIQAKGSAGTATQETSAPSPGAAVARGCPKPRNQVTISAVNFVNVVQCVTRIRGENRESKEESKSKPLITYRAKQRQGRNRSSRLFRWRMKMNKGKINSKERKAARLEVDLGGGGPPTTPTVINIVKLALLCPLPPTIGFHLLVLVRSLCDRRVPFDVDKGYRCVNTR